METENHQPQDIGRVQDLFPPRSLRTEEIGHHHITGGIHSGGEKYLRRTATPTSVKNTRVTDDVITHDKTEYFSHALAEVMDEKNRNEWVFITRYRTGK